MKKRFAFIAATAVALLLLGGIFGLRRGSAPSPAPPGTAATQTAVEQLDASITRAQQRLAMVPGDWSEWATLGLAYVERARVSADPAWYPKADGALKRSLKLHPSGNVSALIGSGALANARHDFSGARGFAGKALAVDPYSAEAYGVLADAYTQLGQPSAATHAVQHMLDLRPGLAAYARASYDLEQHGRTDAASALMRSALNAAVDRSDLAFCHYQLGELKWQAGDVAAADAHYSAGAAADPAYLPLLEGRAKVAAARGDTSAALSMYADLTAKYPSPTYLIEYAELLRAIGNQTEATEQLQLARAALQLFEANGGRDDLGVAALAIATGDHRGAVSAARQEWSRRHFSDVADVLGWALHLAGDNKAAIQYARDAVALGSVNARYRYHLGAIEAALGQNEAARRDLAKSLSANPRFAPLDAPAAQALLDRLGAQ